MTYIVKGVTHSDEATENYHATLQLPSALQPFRVLFSFRLNTLSLSVNLSAHSTVLNRCNFKIVQYLNMCRFPLVCKVIKSPYWKYISSPWIIRSRLRCQLFEQDPTDNQSKVLITQNWSFHLCEPTFLNEIPLLCQRGTSPIEVVILFLTTGEKICNNLRLKGFQNIIWPLSLSLLSVMLDSPMSSWLLFNYSRFKSIGVYLMFPAHVKHL